MAKTPVKDDTPETEVLPADAYKREQDKGDGDPVGAPVEPTKAETVDVAPNEPYPTGGAKVAQGVPHNAPTDEG